MKATVVCLRRILGRVIDVENPTHLQYIYNLTLRESMRLLEAAGEGVRRGDVNTAIQHTEYTLQLGVLDDGEWPCTSSYPQDKEKLEQAFVVGRSVSKPGDDSVIGGDLAIACVDMPLQITRRVVMTSTDDRVDRTNTVSISTTPMKEGNNLTDVRHI